MHQRLINLTILRGHLSKRFRKWMQYFCCRMIYIYGRLIQTAYRQKKILKKTLKFIKKHCPILRFTIQPSSGAEQKRNVTNVKESLEIKAQWSCRFYYISAVGMRKNYNFPWKVYTRVLPVKTKGRDLKFQAERHCIKHC